MTPINFNAVLPPDSDDSAWVNLPPPARQSSLDRRLYAAAGIYGMLREPNIGGVKRYRVERRFAEALSPVGLPGLMSLARLNKDELFIQLTVARLHGLPLPAQLAYFQP